MHDVSCSYTSLIRVKGCRKNFPPFSSLLPVRWRKFIFKRNMRKWVSSRCWSASAAALSCLIMSLTSSTITFTRFSLSFPSATKHPNFYQNKSSPHLNDAISTLVLSSTPLIQYYSEANRSHAILTIHWFFIENTLLSHISLDIVFQYQVVRIIASEKRTFKSMEGRRFRFIRTAECSCNVVKPLSSFTVI